MAARLSAEIRTNEGPNLPNMMEDYCDKPINHLRYWQYNHPFYSITVASLNPITFICSSMNIKRDTSSPVVLFTADCKLLQLKLEYIIE